LGPASRSARHRGAWSGLPRPEAEFTGVGFLFFQGLPTQNRVLATTLEAGQSAYRRHTLAVALHGKLKDMNAPLDDSRCVLCGINSANSSEHVPPRSFFEPPYPENLITVPACDACNHGSHLDDDYLLGFLVSLDTPGASPTLDRVRERGTRGLHRPGFPGLRNRDDQRRLEFARQTLRRAISHEMSMVGPLPGEEPRSLARAYTRALVRGA
jgi:hypothetical protein